MKAKFYIGDYVVINDKYKDRYNQLKGVGFVRSILRRNGRLKYIVAFLGKATGFEFYSYELRKVRDEQEKWEIENKTYRPDPNDMWKCPRCGSKKVHCHAGMNVDRFECMDCHWDWR